MFKKIMAALMAVGVAQFSLVAAEVKEEKKICEKTGKVCTGDMKKAHDCKKGDKDCKKEIKKAHDCKKAAKIAKKSRSNFF